MTVVSGVASLPPACQVVYARAGVHVVCTTITLRHVNPILNLMKQICSNLSSH
jgi:hypothetical protein